MNFIYLFYVLTADCQLTQEHVLKGVYGLSIMGSLQWFRGRDENLDERKKEKISKICTIM